MIHMFSPSLRINQDIIKKYKNKFTQVRSEQIVHQTLEGRGCISESEWHHHEFDRFHYCQHLLFVSGKILMCAWGSRACGSPCRSRALPTLGYVGGVCPRWCMWVEFAHVGHYLFISFFSLLLIWELTRRVVEVVAIGFLSFRFQLCFFFLYCGYLR